MKKNIVGLLLISCNVYTAFSGQFASLSYGLSADQITQFLEKPRTTNLVLFNDVDERILDYSMPWDEENWLMKNAAVTLALRNTLVDNQCLVLCSKANWIVVQLLAQLWNDFCVDSLHVISKNYIEHLSHEKQYQQFYFLWQRVNFETKIKSYQKKINDLTNIYNEINRLFFIGDKSKRTDALKILSEKLLPSHNQPLDEISNISVQQLFCSYVYFDIICEHDYICKQVNDDFILFIPKHLVKQSNNSMIQNVQLGINFSALSNYDYTEIPDRDRRQDIVARASRIDAANSLGEKLLEALKILVLNKYELTREVSELNNDVDKAHAILPFFNIFLDGHGDPDQVTAGISIQKTSSPHFSNFEQLLRFLNTEIKTKSLTVLSCFAGGKKLLDTFNVRKPFDSSILDQITYPIINIGTHMSEASLSVSSHLTIDVDKPVFLTEQELYAPWIPSITIYSDYFSLLDEVPEKNEISSNYEKAFKLISGFYPENKSFFLANYIGVKFPHLSWYSAYEFKKHSKQISQIEALTTKEILFAADPNPSESLKVILLGANVIPGEIRFENFTWNTLPMFLPTNYFNQNYVIQSMNIINVDTSDVATDMYNLMFKFALIFYVHEPINILIKNLMFSHQQYYNVCFFTQQKVSDQDPTRISGLMFTDAQDRTFIATWLSSVNRDMTQPLFMLVQDKNKALHYITHVELQARDALAQFPGLEQDSFKKLEQVMKNKAKSVMPQEVQKSYEIKIKHEMLARVLDTVHQVVQQEKEF